MQVWEWFTSRYTISPEQEKVFQQYLQLIQEATSNVTAIKGKAEIVQYHFADSLELSQFVAQGALPAPTSLVDVGSGAGLPGIPLKIIYPDCRVVLLEVVSKKRQFLQQVIAELGLTGISIEGTDWLTFMRTTPHAPALICARASLPPAELLRMYGAGSKLRRAELVYWASQQWQPELREQHYLKEVHVYTVGDRTRKLVLFAK